MKRKLMLMAFEDPTGGGPRDASHSGVVVESQSPAIGENSVLKEAIGIETYGGVFTRQLEAGVAVPCRALQDFSTAADNQDQILIALYRGNAGMVKDNKRLGLFQIQGIPPAPRGTPRIQVAFIVTRTDIMLEAIDLPTGRRMRLVEVREGSQP